MTDSNTSASEDENYDLVIEGTGLTESILSAAASWLGRKVLHVDKNTFYGSHWASLSINEIDTWTQEHAGSGTLTVSFLLTLSPRKYTISLCYNNSSTYFYSH